ncbi:MAG: adenylate kinase [Myxococcota bacterium]
MDVILFGPPGAGKGTQAGRVSDALNIPHVSTGDLFRKNLKENTALGQLARSFMDKGELVPDEVVFRLVEDRLGEDDAMKGALYDGFPRTVIQADLLNRFLIGQGRGISAVINLNVPDEVLMARIARRREVSQRVDDDAEVVQKRLQVYHTETAPVLGWLREHANVIDIDATKSIEEVGESISAALESLRG